MEFQKSGPNESLLIPNKESFPTKADHLSWKEIERDKLTSSDVCKKSLLSFEPSGEAIRIEKENDRLSEESIQLQAEYDQDLSEDVERPPFYESDPMWNFTFANVYFSPESGYAFSQPTVAEEFCHRLAIVADLLWKEISPLDQYAYCGSAGLMMEVYAEDNAGNRTYRDYLISKINSSSGVVMTPDGEQK